MISIIVRNKNEAEFIGFTLQSCLDFFETPEIIIIDNNSSDDSLDIVQNFNNRTNIRHPFRNLWTQINRECIALGKMATYHLLWFMGFIF